jgi:ornithine cyclodeaminase
MGNVMESQFSRPLFTAEEVESGLSLEDAMAGQRRAFEAFENGTAVMGARGVISGSDSSQFAYIARASSNGPTIVKFGSVTNGNRGSDLPVVQAFIGVLNQGTGSLDYFVDGESVTKLRTTAASMIAAQLLGSTFKKIVVVGDGLQGRSHASAAMKIFQPEELVVVTRSAEKACEDADLIFLCTNSLIPVLTQAPKAGSTVISIGAFAPTRSEVASQLLVNGASIFADDSLTSKNQCGSIVHARAEKPDLQVTSIGAVIANPHLGRKDPHETIYYFSVGLGIQDAMVVEQLLEKHFAG